MNRITSTITLTFGDQAENHVGMEQLGEMVKEGEGFQEIDLEMAYSRLEEKKAEAELYDLTIQENMPSAYLLVLRNGVQHFLPEINNAHNELFNEQASLSVDKKAFMYGRVVNKHARWNLCFDEKRQEPEYEKGKGRIVAWEDVPLTKQLVDRFPSILGKKAKNLKGEGNYYYDISQCGIGFHGDSERRKVVAVRLGASMPIYYQWYKDGQPIGERLEIPLHDGDIYVMSEKAVGTDWKKKNCYTLRHATGSSKFTKP